jgi:hypothetical protein
MLIFSFLKITNKWSKIQVVKHEKYQLSTCYTITYAVMCIDEMSMIHGNMNRNEYFLSCEFHSTIKKQIIHE